LEGIDRLTPAEIGVIWDYQAKTGIRSIKYGCFMPTIGFMDSPNSGVLKNKFYWAPDAPFGASNVSQSGMLDNPGMWL
jgi:hypothetical protein